MAQLPQALQNTAALPDAQPFDLVPAGKYRMIVESTEVKNSNAGDLVMLKLKCKIVEDGPHQGRVVFDQMVIDANRDSHAFQSLSPEQQKKKETAVAIGQGKFKSLCDGVGLAQVQDSDQLCGRPVIGDVKIQKSKDPQYDDRNEIRAFQAARTSNPPPVVQQQGQQPPPPPPSSAPAW